MWGPRRMFQMGSRSATGRYTIEGCLGLLQNTVKHRIIGSWLQPWALQTRMNRSRYLLGRRAWARGTMYMMAVQIDATWRIWRIGLCGGYAVCRCRYCSNLFRMFHVPYLTLYCKRGKPTVHVIDLASPPPAEYTRILREHGHDLHDGRDSVFYTARCREKPNV